MIIFLALSKRSSLLFFHRSRKYGRKVALQFKSESILRISSVTQCVSHTNKLINLGRRDSYTIEWINNRTGWTDGILDETQETCEFTNYVYDN